MKSLSLTLIATLVLGLAGCGQEPPSAMASASLSTATRTLDHISNQHGSAKSHALGFGGASSDFDGDGKSDILWRDRVTGEVLIWLMNGTAIAASGTPGSPGLDWSIEGVGDFNGDGKSDILWRDSNGQTAIWLMNGTAIAGSGSPGAPGVDWIIQGVGDFDGDGKADILWRNSVTGEVAIWFMNGTTIAGSGSPAAPGLDWTIQGVGDFNGDGKADILWRDSNGQTAIWLMNGAAIAGSGSPGAPAVDWSVQGVGDFDGDGKADILWRNSNGQTAIWLMNGAVIAGSGSPGAPGLDWTSEGVGDFDGDGKADILWRNNNEEIAIWLMNGTTIAGSGSPGSTTSVWQIANSSSSGGGSGSSSGSSSSGSSSSGGGTGPFTVGGAVSGLAGKGLALENGPGGAAITIAGNGAGQMYLTLSSGSGYNIMVKTQPTTPAQTCAVTNGSGTISGANVTNVNVSCTTNGPPPSPNGSFIIPPSNAGLIDGAGNVWTVSGGRVYENGQLTLSQNVILLLYYNGLIYQQNSSCGVWSASGTNWVTTTFPTGVTDPVASKCPGMGGWWIQPGGDGNYDFLLSSATTGELFAIANYANYPPGCSVVYYVTLSDISNTLSGSGWAAQSGTGSTIGGACSITTAIPASFTGTVVPTSSINLIVSGVDQTVFYGQYQSGGTLSAGNYGMPPNVQALVGSYPMLSGDTFNVGANGAVSLREASTGCLYTGSVSVIDPAYSVYRLKVTASGCRSLPWDAVLETGLISFLGSDIYGNDVVFGGTHFIDNNGAQQLKLFQ